MAWGRRRRGAVKAGATQRRGSRAPRPERFQAERRALRKVQLHFEFQQALMQRVRMAAAAENLTYADFVRKLVGLPYARIQRPRISLSFSEEDLALLAGRYRAPAGELALLKQRVMEEVSHRFRGEEAKARMDA